MLVRCVVNDLAKLDKSAQIDRFRKEIHLQGANYDLVVGTLYKVQAMEFVKGYLRYYIHTVESNNYPFPYPAEFFSVVDGSVPNGWSASVTCNDDGVFLKRLSFPEWANDDVFYEKLIEDDPNCCAVYLAHRSEK